MTVKDHAGHWLLTRPIDRREFSIHRNLSLHGHITLPKTSSTMKSAPFVGNDFGDRYAVCSSTSLTIWSIWCCETTVNWVPNMHYTSNLLTSIQHLYHMTLPVVSKILLLNKFQRRPVCHGDKSFVQPMKRQTIKPSYVISPTASSWSKISTTKTTLIIIWTIVWQPTHTMLISPRPTFSDTAGTCV